MNKYLFSFVFISLTSFSILAQNVHKVGLGFNYHLDQKSNPGYQITYQWQFSQSYELEARYLSSSDVEITKNEQNILGDYNQFSLGANFIKRYNKNLSLKAGTGLGFVTSSSNKNLVASQTMAPYVKLAASYQLTKQSQIEIGQINAFNNDNLSTNHSVYLAFNYQFGSPSRLFQQAMESNDTNTQVEQQTKTQSPTPYQEINSRPINRQITSEAKISQDNFIAGWYIQFGAYQNRHNANKRRAQLQTIYPSLAFSLLKHKQYYRIVSQRFLMKQRADDYIGMINSQYSLKGYVTKLEP